MAKLQVKNRFGSVPNIILNDGRLTLKAKWLFAYIQSKPDDWDFSAERIAWDNSDGRDSVRAALKELEDAKLLLRKTTSLWRGKFETEYILFEDPHELEEFVRLSTTENPSSKDTGTEFTTTENTTSKFTTSKNPSSNKERSTKKEIQNKKEIFADFSEKFWSVFESFEKHRSQKKNRLTDIARSRALKDLSAYDETTAIAMVEQTLRNGWTGIFPIKDARNVRREAPKNVLSEAKDYSEGIEAFVR